tara:strand:- start:163 stop:654 length:492 start_codon:yes stop_codon:yes gene_type:complete
MPTKTNKSPYTIAPAILGLGIKGLAGGIGNVIKQKRAAEEAGEDFSFKQGLGSLATGAAGALTGNDYTQQEQPMEETPSYSVAPMAMKPFKALSPYTASYSAYNMSAKQAKREEQMKQVSGSNSALQTNAFMGALRSAQENNKPTFKVGDEVHENKDYDPNRD